MRWIKNAFAVLSSKRKRHLFHSCGKNVYFGKIGELHGPNNISIGDDTCFGDYLFLSAWLGNKGNSTPEIVIGSNCNFGAMNHITCCNKIIIGNHVLTGKWVTITDNSHGETDMDSLSMHPLERPMFSKGPVVIEDDVWIGDGARILPGLTIGKGAVVGANAVVTKDVAPYEVVCGIPAKPIK